MAKLTLDQKRLEVLRHQLYGKEDKLPKKPAEIKTEFAQTDNQLLKESHKTEAAPVITTTYLRNDLTKILVLSTIAIAAQVLIYFLSKNNLVNLKFF